MRLSLRKAGLTAGASCIALMLGAGASFAGMDEAKKWVDEFQPSTLSKDEQLKRLRSRLEDPDKLWKHNDGDMAERKLWDQYQEAYEDAVNKCSTKHAPWHVVPADHKWYRNWVVSKVIADAL